MNTENSMVVTRGRGVGKGKRDQICGDKNDLTLAGGHTVQYTDYVS